ncbi:helix-turn-helix domain-containing protein [Paenibacillus sp. IHBB 10380]|uniref:helix-turn-helix domain-containing protein n=1 Tax=Paenibacillus sp. IHBB 10380 TaxID=1566358 RepID=UPI0005CFE4B7|nr:helix-turn-helix domain-containing protein [Paenibacillus sp. IHBB 10380]AJS58578.1 2-hydroxyacid dehydrogenase [Paenibacillus sp. IHBB 10380]
MENRFYTIDQVAEILDIHHKTVRKFIKEGKLKANKVGKQWRISQIDLDIFTRDKKSIMENEVFSSDEEIEFSNRYIKKEKTSEIKVSSVIDLEEISKDEYSRISNMLLAIMNCKDEKIYGYTINMKYSQNENRLKIMLWASLELTKEILDIISILTKKENGGEDNGEI